MSRVIVNKYIPCVVNRRKMIYDNPDLIDRWIFDITIKASEILDIWLRNYIGTFSALLLLHVGNPLVTGFFSLQKKE